jgi:hypothetical protein
LGICRQLLLSSFLYDLYSALECCHFLYNRLFISNLFSTTTGLIVYILVNDVVSSFSKLSPAGCTPTLQALPEQLFVLQIIHETISELRQRGFSDKTVKYSGQEKELRGGGVSRKIQIRNRNNKKCGISRFPVNSHKIFIIYIILYSERIFYS